MSHVKNPHAQALGKRGGQARAARLSKEQRSESARQAAKARWAKKKRAPIEKARVISAK